MSIHPKLAEVMDEARDDLLKAAERYLVSPQPTDRIKAHFVLNVLIPFADWFKDEATNHEISRVAKCASEGLGKMVALLASTAGDDMMEDHANLILQVIALEIGTALTTNTE